MKKIDLEETSFVDLKEYASELGLNPSKKKKAELLASIKRKLNSLQKKKEAEAKEEVQETIKEIIRPVRIVRTPIVPKVEEELKLPVFENIQILKIMESGHNATHLHCEMANGTRMHVPRYRLVDHGKDL